MSEYAITRLAWVVWQVFGWAIVVVVFALSLHWTLLGLAVEDARQPPPWAATPWWEYP